MKNKTKKALISGLVAGAILTSATLGGCSLVSTNNLKDMEQVIAEVNVSKAKDFDEDLAFFKSAVDTTATIKKRELVSYFVNVGYSYIQQGYSYEAVFSMLVDALVDNAVLTQYATLYLLNEKAGSGDKTAVLNEFNSKATLAEKYEYLLDEKDVKIARYSLMSALNSAIDGYEERNIKSESSSAGSGTRTTPSDVDAEKEDYYPVADTGFVAAPDGFNEGINYYVYTGYNNYTLDCTGTYKDDRSQLLKDNSTKATRIKAYNEFISGLASYNLIDVKKESVRSILGLEYIEDEYVSQLEQRCIEKYYDLYEDEQEENLARNEYIQSVYQDILNLQKKQYKEEDDFATALGNLSDTSFLLYSPSADNEENKYGYVYNILLPFSAAQNAKLTELKAAYKDDDDKLLPEYYTYRNQLLKNIRTTDQREAWFNGTTEYAFDAEKAGLKDYYKKNNNSNWLFFENNLVNTERYENIDKYAGKYPYNGTVIEKDEKHDNYILFPNELTIDDMLDEFSAYVNYILGAENTDKVNVTVKPETEYYKTYGDDLYEDVKEKEIDYENFVYASGNVKFAQNGANKEEYNRVNVFNKDSEQYQALSAVNELQYAYTTDTGVLSQYVGYSVEAGQTSYIKEFEYAAQKAVRLGAGNFIVCAGDFGWHLVYVTYTFDANDANQFSPDWETNIDIEGTFENLFYEMIKKNDISDISTKRRSWIITRYNTEDSVTKYVKRYQDLLDLNSGN